jgi:pyridoxal phosphate enzyme (YggS family)
MHTTLEKLNRVKNKVNEIINKKQLKTDPKIIVVTKTFPLNKIIPLLQNGHIHYAENKIQEAENKWIDTKNRYKDLQLHMIGKLQTNKAKKAIKLFDYIHSLDNDKLALKLSHHEKELNKKVKLFIQVKLSEEDQKSGVQLNELNNFYSYCTSELSLNVIGLMCLPPIDSNAHEYFKILKKNAEKLNLKDLSMGMSSDFEQAISNGSTYLRLGTIILGKRNFS